MRLNSQLVLNWLVFVTASIILTLLWLQKFDVERETIDETVHDATVFIRVANFVLTSEILLALSTFYGGITWYIIRKKSIETKHIDLWSFYDGGSALFPTVKAFICSGFLSFRLLSMVAVTVMIGSYFLDIYYINSITYDDIERCEIRNTTIDIMTLKDRGKLNLDIYSEVYATGSRIGLLPFSDIEYTNTYVVPSLGNITYLQNYTTIAYSVSVQCQNAPMKISNSSGDLAVDAKGYNGTYTELLWAMPKNIIDKIITYDDANVNADEKYYFFVTVAGVKQDNNNPNVDLTPIRFAQHDLITAHCSFLITPRLINNIYGWNHILNYAYAEDMAQYVSRAMINIKEAYSTTDGLFEWLVDAKMVSGNGSSTIVANISISSLEKKITMIMIEFLKGGGMNGSTTTPGYFCFPDSYKSSIMTWYKAVFTVVQVITVLFLTAYTVLSSKMELVNNDTDTLLRYINIYNDNKVLCYIKFHQDNNPYS